jgi:predicted flavoprotein YhiN
MAQANVPADRRAAEFSNDERGRLIEQLKRCQVRVTGSRGFDKAEVTAGGVALEEVDSRTMQSKLVPNLYLAGEILDLDGFIGGYNFQAAFSTGWLAGESV